jgi:DNA invertase Pin-like site-specific DNA recombinase
MDRPALQRLLANIAAERVDVVVYDRLTRSLADFAKVVEILGIWGPSCVSVTQQFNTTTSDGAAEPQCAVVLCAVGARGHRRAHPRKIVLGNQCRRCR